MKTKTIKQKKFYPGGILAIVFLAAVAGGVSERIWGYKLWTNGSQNRQSGRGSEVQSTKY